MARNRHRGCRADTPKNDQGPLGVRPASGRMLINGNSDGKIDREREREREKGAGACLGPRMSPASPLRDRLFFFGRIIESMQICIIVPVQCIHDYKIIICAKPSLNPTDRSVSFRSLDVRHSHE
jgi:hypothetical protein